jgi:hypothetical protein
MILPMTAVGVALRTVIKRLRRRKAVAFAVEETTEAGDHPHHRIKQGRFGRLGRASRHRIDRFPCASIKAPSHGIAGQSRPR